MNRYEYGKVLNILKMNEPMKGAAVTEPFNDRAELYSLGKGTDIEAESFHQYHILIVAQGTIECYALNEGGIQKRWNVREGGMTMLPVDMPVGVNAREDAVYARISAVRREDINPELEEEKEYLLNDMVSFEDRNTSVVWLLTNEQMRIALVSMDENTSWSSEASADSGFYVIDGSFEIIMNEQTFTIHHGEGFIAPKDQHLLVQAAHGRTRLIVIQNNL